MFDGHAVIISVTVLDTTLNSFYLLFAFLVIVCVFLTFCFVLCDPCSLIATVQNIVE